jgi:ribose 5-phosphate isomerase B
MILGIGSDHWGAKLKGSLCEYFSDRGIQMSDFGSDSDDPSDYPDIAQLVAEAIADRRIQRGILICRTGLGMAIAANKVPGIYAATVHNVATARAAAASNKAQVITMGSEGLSVNDACAMVSEWLRTPFKGGPSAQKVSKISALERKYSRSYQVKRGE